MSCNAWNEVIAEELFFASERVAAGCYQEIETGREVRLDKDDFLPASVDGHVAPIPVCALTGGTRKGLWISSHRAN